MLQPLMPSATLLCGPLSMYYLGLFGAGVVIETNPYDLGVSFSAPAN